MVRRTRDIQKKIWLTPQEERTIAKKMEMIGTENFGAYARKMLIDGYIIVVDYTEQKKLAAEINKVEKRISDKIENCLDKMRAISPQNAAETVTRITLSLMDTSELVKNKERLLTG